MGRKQLALATLSLFAAALFLAYGQRHHYSDDLAELSRSLIGDENTARVESWYFAVQDRVDQIEYRLFGAETNPFGTEDTTLLVEPDGAFGLDDGAAIAPLPLAPEPVYVPPARPAPLPLPETKTFLPSQQPGEGVWTTAGLPRTSPEDVLMARTFVRPDAARPYSVVGVLLLDKRRIRLHITGGTADPGGERGVKGPGVIPQALRKDLLAAWNGGFQGAHGSFGMYADGRTYKPLRNGFASIAVMKDGSVRMGEWGRDLWWSDDIAAVRQNAALLVDNCEVSRRTREGNNTWGYVEVNSAEFITWRSAVGLTQNGDLLVAAGNSLSAETLARGLWAAGACSAMQLDINMPYVLASLYHAQADGSLKATKFMDSMTDNPARFLSTQARDFMFVTLDETNYLP
jgi:hypothetical protein